MKLAFYLRLKQQIRGWLPSDRVESFETRNSRHGHILWYFLAVAILGILIYAPLIPVHGSGFTVPIVTPSNNNTNSCCDISGPNVPISVMAPENNTLLVFQTPGFVIPPHINSITMQFLGFGTQYYYGSYGGLSFWFGGNGGFGVLLWGDLLIALAAVTVAQLVSFIFSKNALKGVSFQLGVGVLALISPVILLVLGVEPMWLNILLAEEITNAGAVLVLTAIAEMWWFRFGKITDYAANELDLEL